MTISTILTTSSEEEYPHESQEIMARFQDTLKTLTMNLRKVGVWKKQGDLVTEPVVYDLNYVLRLTAEINDKREGRENASVCKKFIKSCFQATCRQSGALACLIEVIPKDIYVSVLSGGFAIILAASGILAPWCLHG